MKSIILSLNQRQHLTTSPLITFEKLGIQSNHTSTSYPIAWGPLISHSNSSNRMFGSRGDTLPVADEIDIRSLLTPSFFNISLYTF